MAAREEGGDLKVKVVFGKDIRLWRCPAKNCYEELLVFVEKTFQKKEKEIQIQYEDTEMDKITLTNEQDFQDAVNCALAQKRKSLKLFVVAKNVEKKEEKEDSNNWRKLALSFLCDEKVNELLPKLIYNVTKTIRANYESGKEEGLAKLVEQTLLDETFAPIVCHEFYQKNLKSKISFWLTNMSTFDRLLLNLDEQHVMAMSSNIMNAITTALNTQDDEKINELLWNPRNLLFTANNHFQQSNKDQVIHHNVKCHGCGISPIRGIRFKCTICENHDLCSTCESLKKYDKDHPLQKITTSAIKVGNENAYGQDTKKKRKSEQPRAEWVNDGRDDDRIFGFVNAIVEKTWTMKNVGCEEWGDDIQFLFVKGNETLPLEKCYSVSNVKPNETVQISVLLQLPSLPGRFSVYFRLNKNGYFFGPRLCVDINGIEEEEEEEEEEEDVEKNRSQQQDENKLVQQEKEKSNVDDNDTDSNNNENDCICICGVPMIETTPIDAYYHGADVHCDLCEVDCPDNSVIFHCISENSTHHPTGYDLCLNCAQSKMQSFQ